MTAFFDENLPDCTLKIQSLRRLQTQAIRRFILSKFNLEKFCTSSLQATLFLCAIFFLPAKNAQAQGCDLPPGVTLSGSNIVGPMTLNIGNRNTENVNLYVENITWPDGRCAAKVFRDSSALWVKLYDMYVNKGITSKNIRILIDSIRGVPGAGVYVKNNVGACGYNGYDRTIHCTESFDPGMLYMMAHENMHGWQFQSFVNNPIAGINYLNAFTHFSNLVYRDYMRNPINLSGTNWNLIIPNSGVPGVVNWIYGLQNQAEWGAESFSDWLHGTSYLSAWPYAKERQPVFASYLACLLTTDTLASECGRLLNSPLQIAENDPRVNPPVSVRTEVVVDGVTKILNINQAQSRAIWTVCFNNQTRSPTSQSDLDVMNAVIRSASPYLPESPGWYYKLGYADANHDNVYDWVCTYEGMGPKGVGTVIIIGIVQTTKTVL